MQKRCEGRLQAVAGSTVGAVSCTAAVAPAWLAYGDWGTRSGAGALSWMSMKIAAFTSERFGSSHYRVFDPLRELVRRGHEGLLTLESIELTPAVASCDVAYLHRYQDAGTQRALRRLRAAGLPVVWDHDDNIAAAPERRRGALQAQEASSGIAAMAQLADVVTTTNELLAEQYRAAGATRVHIVPNYLPEHFSKLRRTTTSGALRIGWIAWADHQRDWNELGLRHTARRLLAEHADLWIESVGPIDLGIDHKRYIRTGPVAFSQLAAKMAAFDVGLAVISDTPFNRGRSDIKVKEYAALGVPWLASAAGPYLGLGERQGGLLVADDGWDAALRRIVTDGRLRKKLARRGEKWARGHRLADNVGAWERAFLAAIEARAATRSPA